MTNLPVAAAAASAKSLQSSPTLCDPIDGSPPGSLSLGFSRQEYWSGLPFPSPMHEREKDYSSMLQFPSPGDLSQPRMESGIFISGRFFTV